MCEMCKTNRLAKLRTAQAVRQNWRCFYCDFPMWDGDPRLMAERYHLPVGLLNRLRCTAEHLKPRTNGGRESLDNIVAACVFCNQTRHKMRDVLSPVAYQQRVRRRVEARKWHPLECHPLLR
ncbi:MAG: HNH endonuclease [Mesorhizobium sp.]|nr:MAG: HNH endonuclease [Mesorhizobium sp.]RWC64054.1 MAG: HNH endonuclease [Mesorhizobium sp.]